jgi:hypothetical protein
VSPTSPGDAGASGSTLFDPDPVAGTPDPVAGVPDPVAGVPDPVAGVPNAASAAKSPGEGFDDDDGTGLEVTPEMKERAKRAADAAAAANDLLARLRESAGPMVADARFLPLGEDVLSIVRPAVPSPALAVVRGGAAEETVEV